MKCSTLIVVMLLVIFFAGCAGKPKKSAKPSPAPKAETLPQVPRKAPLSPYAQRSVRNRILALANREWDYFGQQQVIYEPNGESIPHVGYWEDEDYAHSDRVNQYWRAAYTPGLNGRDCQQPWSAAFISWVMNSAGVDEELFPPARAHWVYLSRFIARNGSDGIFIPRTIHEYSPQPGDLICANRESGFSSYISEPVDDMHLENTKLHCDIVVGKENQTLYAIGGNVRNSVSKSVLELTPEGFLQPTRTRQWFLVVENRLY